MWCTYDLFSGRHISKEENIFVIGNAYSKYNDKDYLLEHFDPLCKDHLAHAERLERALLPIKYKEEKHYLLNRRFPFWESTKTIRATKKFDACEVSWKAALEHADNLTSPKELLVDELVILLASI